METNDDDDFPPRGGLVFVYKTPKGTIKEQPVHHHGSYEDYYDDVALKTLQIMAEVDDINDFTYHRIH